MTVQLIPFLADRLLNVSPANLLFVSCNGTRVKLAVIKERTSGVNFKVRAELTRVAVFDIVPQEKLHIRSVF